MHFSESSRIMWMVVQDPSPRNHVGLVVLYSFFFGCFPCTTGTKTPKQPIKPHQSVSVVGLNPLTQPKWEMSYLDKWVYPNVLIMDNCILSIVSGGTACILMGPQTPNLGYSLMQGWQAGREVFGSNWFSGIILNHSTQADASSIKWSYEKFILSQKKSYNLELQSTLLFSFLAKIKCKNYRAHAFISILFWLLKRITEKVFDVSNTKPWCSKCCMPGGVSSD